MYAYVTHCVGVMNTCWVTLHHLTFIHMRIPMYTPACFSGRQKGRPGASTSTHGPTCSRSALASLAGPTWPARAVGFCASLVSRVPALEATPGTCYVVFLHKHQKASTKRHDVEIQQAKFDHLPKKLASKLRALRLQEQSRSTWCLNHWPTVAGRPHSSGDIGEKGPGYWKTWVWGINGPQNELAPLRKRKTPPPGEVL